MYNESYDDYIRNILGYPSVRNNIQQRNNMYNNDMCTCNMFGEDTQTTVKNMQNMQNTNQEIEECYPEIYKIVYPMVRNACAKNTKPITRRLIDEITNEIYLSIESNNEVNININLQNEVQHTGNRSKVASSNEMKNVTSSAKVDSTTVEKRIENKEDRQIRNRGLNDLIIILLIRELLGRPGFIGPRPPFPGGPGGRPPMRPRMYDDLDIYEQL